MSTKITHYRDDTKLTNFAPCGATVLTPYRPNDLSAKTPARSSREVKFVTCLKCLKAISNQSRE